MGMIFIKLLRGGRLRGLWITSPVLVWPMQLHVRQCSRLWDLINTFYLVQWTQTGCNNIIHKATLHLPYIKCHLELTNGTAWYYMANVGYSVIKQTTENGVTLKAKQDERTIASFWAKPYLFSFRNIVCFISLFLDVVIIPLTKTTGEELFTVFVVYYRLRRSEAKTANVNRALAVSFSLVGKEKGYRSHLSKVALWQVRHEDSVFCSFNF